VNGTAGTAIPVTVALFVPGIDGADASDVVALYLTQNVGDLVSVTLGKLNALEFARGRPIVGGDGIDTFWNTEIAAPITGNFPPTLVGAQVNIETQPVSLSVTVFDPEDATNRLFSHLFDNGVSVMGTATLKTELAGRTGYYGIKGIYSTREGADLSQIIPPSGVPRGILTKQGSYYVSLSMQQYLIQDLGNPARGWGMFGELAKGDANPNLLDWSVYGGGRMTM
jgi:porin